MKRLVTLILIVVPLYYLHDTRPTFADHAARIYERYSGEQLNAGGELPPWPQWQQLEFRDFFLLTATADSDKKTLVSYGFAGYIKVVDEEWAQKAFQAGEGGGGG